MTNDQGPTTKDQRSRTTLAALLVVAAAVRFYQLGHGIPYAIGVDEPELMERVVAMMKTGDFNPHFFHYPGLYFYLLLPVACAKFVAGAVQGQWTTLAQVSASDFYLWGRALTAALGTATVALVFVGARRWGAPTALLAAALLAVAPLHVRESHYVLTDVPAAFFVALSWVLSLRALDRPAPRAFLVAGIVAGLATATKYTAGVALLMPVVGAMLTTSELRVRLAMTAAMGFGAGFLVGAPYTLLDLPGFLNGFADLMRSYPPRGKDVEPGWLVYLKHFRINFGWAASVATALGFLLALRGSVMGRDRAAWALTLGFPIVFFLAIADARLIFARYLMPLVPQACVLAGVGVGAVVTWAGRFGRQGLPLRPVMPLAAALLLAAPVMTSYGFAQRIAQPSTAGQAYTWIQQHVPRDSKVLLEKYELRLPGPRYKVEHVPSLVGASLDELRKSGVQYAVASSQVYGAYLERPTADPDRYAAYQALFEGAREVARFAPDDRVIGPELRVLALEPSR